MDLTAIRSLVGLAAWRYRISLNPVEHKTVVVFEDLLVGETFEFAPRINVGWLKYNQLCRKVSPDAYELGNTKRRIGNRKNWVRRIASAK